MLAGEHLAGAAETHGHLIGDEEHVIAPGHLPDLRQIAGRLGDHARGALHHRLHDHRRQFLVVRRHQLFQPGETLLPAIFPMLAPVAVGGRGLQGVEQQRLVNFVE